MILLCIVFLMALALSQTRYFSCHWTHAARDPIQRQAPNKHILSPSMSRFSFLRMLHC